MTKPNVTPIERDVLTVAEAARRLGISPNTYKRGLRDGVLPGMHFGSTYLITRQSFERFLALGHLEKESA